MALNAPSLVVPFTLYANRYIVLLQLSGCFTFNVIGSRTFTVAKAVSAGQLPTAGEINLMV